MSKRTLYWQLAGFALAAVTFILLGRDNWRWMNAGMAVLYGGCLVGYHLMRKQDYRNGWMDGRLMMMMTLDEARRRGLSVQEWALLEAERDGIVTVHDKTPRQP